MPGYDNTVKDQEVSLGIERFLIAPYGTTWTATRVNMDSVPSGFTDLGAVVEDSPTISVTREKFQLRTGIPSVIQYEAIVGLGAQVAFALHSMDARRVSKALGSVEAVNVLRDAIGTDATTIASVTNASVITLEGSPGTALKLGARILTAASSSAAFQGTNESYVSSISGLDLAVTPAFASTPTAGDYVAEVGGIRIAIGTVKRLEYHVLGVADFIDGVQVVHDFQRVMPAGDWQETIQPGANTQTPLAFDARGYISSIYTGDKQLIVAERWMFPSIGSV